ncbi:50S ribosomal protein L10 [Carboxylicivirga mesophila]|uniref:Large ribosomal subunit protein uL10 n=1 Tax=Carboxylicivirga mesophila TaxID=1166478 RepID=A0ABS5KAK2_9BACT|nr:50S ribosomal protein L10 [Carboxylicivirga mesophila]MBS2212054.1 50S ribosomal protein L10 [Carboxylicivirga mesophila]
MRKEDKSTLVNELLSNLNEYSHFYVTEAGGLNAENSSKLRRECFSKEVKMIMVKNTIFKKALEQHEGEYEELYDTLKGTTAIMFSNTGNVPAKLIKEFSKGKEKPTLKGAYVEESLYVGADQLEALCNIKSKDELLGDVIGLLQSPMKNVVSALQSGGSTIHGLLQTLAEKE